jgi:serine/threonine-protein kinase
VPGSFSDISRTAPAPSTIAGRYAVERELGRGGMATVYLARDLRHDAPVAIKVLHRDLVSHLSGERFTREIRITARLQHPHVLPVLDSGVDDGLPFYTMPYVEGETLADRIARERQLPLDDAVRIARHVADALAYAHAQGIVHRDVKPSNILLAGYPPRPGQTSEWHALLADFGIARAVDTSAAERLTDSAFAVGTATYMSPEQSAGDRVDGRADVYALGCVLYEMLAGTPPFHGSTPQAILARHAVDPVPSLRTVRATVSPALDAVVARALAKVPADRYADGGAMRDAIAAAAARPDRGVGAMTRPATRRRLLVAGAVAAAVVAAAVGAAWWALGGRGAPLDAGRVMVFPLDVPASAGLPPSSGEDVTTMVGNALDGVGPLRWIDGWRELAPAQRAGGAPLGSAEARALARAKGCAWFVVGRLTPLGGDSVSVRLDLYGAADGEPAARGEARGARADAWRLGLRAANALLPTLIPGGATRVDAEWARRSPDAVARFLLGEAAFRRLHAAEALAHYRDAVARDSTFALAALRGAQAAGWGHETAQTEQAAALVALALRQSLSPRDRHFALGDQAYLEGRADSAARELGRATALDPEMAAAWAQLGETFVHLLPLAGNVDSLATAAFERAHALDPSATGPASHLVELRLRHGDVGGAAALAERLLAAQPEDTVLAKAVTLLVSCARGGPSSVTWTREAAADPLGVLEAARRAGPEAGAACAEAGFDAVLRAYPPSAPDAVGYRWIALVGLQSVLLARGDVAGARRRLDSAIAEGLGGGTLYLMDATVVPAMADSARAIAARDSAQYGAAYGAMRLPQWLWYLGAWAVSEGRLPVAHAVASDLDARAARSGASADSLLARSLGARVALLSAATRADSDAAIAALTGVLAAPAAAAYVTWDAPSARAGERLLLARALDTRGDHARAIEVANVFDSMSQLGHVLFLPASLELRASAALALNRRDDAARFQRRLTALRGGR